MRRRTLIGAAAAGATAAVAGCGTPAGRRSGAQARVVVVGGGYGGTTAAKYLRLFSGDAIDVTLVEPSAAFVSCPLSNLVVAGWRELADITLGYDALRQRHGVTVVADSATAIDVAGRSVRLARGDALRWDRLVLAPGADLMLGAVPGLSEAASQGRMLQAWKAGAETTALRAQLQAMRDGGTFAITVPEAPYRCPPGPYERASVVAAYLKAHKPRSKVLVLDANADIVSKPALFRRAWADLYPGMIEYRPLHKMTQVDGAAMRVGFELQDDVKADVWNVLPPMRAGALALQAGLAASTARWCPVHYRSFESTLAPGVHVVGDSIQAASAMPKSGHMANAHAKVAAAAIAAQLAGREPDARPMLSNTCYSWVSKTEAIHVASIHAYDAAASTYVMVPGSGGVSAARSVLEAQYAGGWARNIWADMLG